MLRFVAVFLVLGRHMGTPPATWPGSARFLLSTWHCGGWVGVDLFFVLSGFLVSGLLFSELKVLGKFSILRFYTRRGWRIYPPFIVLTATTVIVCRAFGIPIPPSWILSECLFLQSYLPGLWNHTWSLAVEEHFYLLLPLSLLLLLKVNRGSARPPVRPLLTGAAIIALSVLALRLFNFYERSSYDHVTHLLPTHLRLDSLSFGVAISSLYHFETAQFHRILFRWRKALVLIGALTLVPAFIFPIESTPYIYTFGFTFFYLGSGVLMVGMLLWELPSSRIVTAAAALGMNSYSIYLWHMPVSFWGGRVMNRLFGSSLGYGGRTLIYLIGSFVVGTIMARLVELPALRLRDRWFPAKTAGAIEIRPEDASR